MFSAGLSSGLYGGSGSKLMFAGIFRLSPGLCQPAPSSVTTACALSTRLQVEHGITEAVFDVDLVEWMIRQEADEFILPLQAALVPQGAAIEVRLYAENPSRNFEPSTGLLTEVRFPETVRVDGWIETGSTVTPFYDPMLAKLIATGKTRTRRWICQLPRQNCPWLVNSV